MHNTTKNDSYDRKITKEFIVFINMDNEESIKKIDHDIESTSKF
jgi:hypothetical protein